MLELANKDFKTVIITVFHIFKNSKDMEDMKSNQIQLLEMKTAMCIMKST